MINNILEFSMRQRGVVVLCAAGLLIFGLFSLLKLPIDAVPDFCLLYTSDAADE